MRLDEAIKELKIEYLGDSIKMREAKNMAIKALEQEPCEDVCERFEQSIDIVTDIVEFRFSDGTVKRAKRGLYMRDIEESLRKMLIDQMANEKKQEPCADMVSRDAMWEVLQRLYGTEGELVEELMSLPPVLPMPKMGKWVYDKERDSYKCSLCGFFCAEDKLGAIPTMYCANCGSYNGGTE